MLSNTLSILAAFHLFLLLASEVLAKQTAQPLVGILSQPADIGESSFRMNYPHGPKSHSYLTESATHLVESSGAHAVAVEYDLPHHKLLEILENLQGIVFQGGAVGGEGSELYSSRVKFIVDWAKTANSQGRRMFIFAYCKGYEELVMACSSSAKVITCGYDNLSKNRSVTILPAALSKTAYLSTLSLADMRYTLEEQGIFFFHKCGVSAADLPKFTSEFHLVGTADLPDKNATIVALIEHKTYPFVGMQFHPEANAFHRYGTHNREKRSLRYHRRSLAGLVQLAASKAKPIDELPYFVQSRLLITDAWIRVTLYYENIFVFPRWPEAPSLHNIAINVRPRISPGPILKESQPVDPTAPTLTNDETLQDL